MAYYGGFGGLIQSLNNWGIFDVILPFILIFTIVFAVLEKTKILGTTDDQVKKYSAVVSLVVAMSVIFSHYYGIVIPGTSVTVVTALNNALPQVSLLLVAIVMVLLTLGLWTGKRADGSKGPGKVFTVLSGALVVVIFIVSMGWWNLPGWMWGLLNSDVIALVIAILVFGLIMKFITGTSKTPEQKEKQAKIRRENWESFLNGKQD
ncbi:MAG: hypothetical protein ACOCQQ_01650 [Candidatus Nanoarchaeia archaeon]